ncbi:MAG: sensor histidine kinase [Clostridiales bacterium]|nr:sensor histidine kinase [Clostridiales bacterium]
MKLDKFLSNMKISRKPVAVFLATSVIAMCVNLFIYINLNQALDKINSVFSSNISLNELSDSLNQTHQGLTGYLETKGTDDLELYFASYLNVKQMMRLLNSNVTDNNVKLAERDIREMLDTYLKTADEAVQAKRGRNIDEYTAKYNECTRIKDYLNTYIYSVNNEQFRTNSENYLALVNSLRYTEIMSMLIFAVASVMNVLLIIILTSTITRPLTRLSSKAEEIISAGSPENIEPLEVRSGDEVGKVTMAFNEMLASIKDYIARIRTQLITQSEMKEKNLLMETHLKDAQLKYLQSQINPHFLFNTLNAGAQLAMMEGADRTVEYIRNMADFFRYNVKKSSETVKLSEEIELVDSYMYILNVRFAGEMLFEKDIDESLLNVMVPSMIIQPLVENSIKYGIKDLEPGEGKVTLSVYREDGFACIRVSDNGIGTDEEIIEKIMNHEKKPSETRGVGITNVMSRLDLYYNNKEVFEMKSRKNEGTHVTIKIPLEDTNV